MQVVWLAEIKWDYLRTRKQQLIERRPRDVDVVFFEPYVRGRPNRYDLRDAAGVRVATIPFAKSVPRGIGRLLMDRAALRRVVDAAALRRVRAHLGAAGVDPAASVVVVSNVYAIRIATALRPRALVYDCNDAHAEFPGLPGWTRDYQDETFRRAGAVVVSSRGLLAAAGAARGSLDGVHLVGNGVDFPLFHAAADRADSVPPGDVCVGYVGAVAPWFDFDLVAAMARAQPAWRFEIVGPVLGGAEGDLARLAALPNVAVGGAVPHGEVPAVLARFTVGMIPFRRNALTAGVNPNKLYEYLAAGLPVVATPFSRDVEEAPDVIALAGDAASFATACRSLADARRDPARGLVLRSRAAEIARAHDWDTIAGAFWARVVAAERSA
ncbi:MAG TPA: glycosyltransferase [Candidatus Krumholzibacteria bacterium]|nr:glycosyltransferase [Candidatus Krumholzibacteria bacterium]